MGVNDKLSSLSGRWKGTNRLFASWTPEGIFESESTAVVSPKISGQFLEIAYTWSHEGAAHEGVLVIGCDTKSDAVQAVWTDSWHLSHKFMLCDGTAASDGSINIFGQYAVAGHPDWGWRTEIIPTAEGFTYRMFNVSPEGEEDIAVETQFTRAG